jgi:hypothetical protein
MFRDNVPIHTPASIWDFKWRARWIDEPFPDYFARYCLSRLCSLLDREATAGFPLIVLEELQDEL